MTDAGPLLSAALALAEEGLPVFLLGRTKRPVANCPACPPDDTRRRHDPGTCGHLTCHGFYAATRDPDRIRAMHAAVPGGLLAIRTGTISDLAVIDIDPRNGGQLIPELMPPTRCVRTGSDGWHLYYRHPGMPLGPHLVGHSGIDVKADGGYVVAPPSIHPGTRRPYRWVRDRPMIEMRPPLIAACRAADPPPAAAPQPFRVLLTGSRTWTNDTAIVTVLDQLHARYGTALVVVHGACPRGADAIADAWCRQAGVTTERHPADWSTGRAAGPARNAVMVNTRPELCLAFIRDNSPGATGCARLAEQAGITVLRNPIPNDLPPAVSRPPAVTPTTIGGRISSPTALLAAHLSAVDRAPLSRRRHTLYGAARGVARMVAAGAITAVDAYAALHEAGRRAEQNHRDIHAAITGGFHAESVATEGIAA